MEQPQTFPLNLERHPSRLKPEILGLVETRCRGDHADKICNSLGYEFWVRVEALGLSGGIWILWKESVDTHVPKTHPQFIHVSVQNNTSPPWFLSVVYGSPNPSLRKHM